MANAFILFGGIVKQATNVPAYTFNNKSGFVATFTFGTVKYTHTLSKNYTGGTNGTLDEGYYPEVQFLQFITSGENKPSPFNLTLLPNAVAGDNVIVSRLKNVAPYTDFCKINQYSWSYDPTADVRDVNGNIIIPAPALANPNPVNVPLSPQTVYDFYANNITLITSADFTDNKDDAAYSLALCAVEISRINQDIFPLFNQSSDLAAYITAQNNLWSRGTIFNQPTYEDILQYEENLVNYYQAAYSNQYYIAGQDAGTKLFWLASVLDPSGLAVFPVDTKLSLLSQIVDINVHTLANPPFNPWSGLVPLLPQMILGIVASVVDVPTQTDYFLNQLLVIKYNHVFSSDETLFEALYNTLTDNDIGTLTAGLIGKNADRKQFIQSIYDIWKSSKFYPYYNAPDYTQPVNPVTLVYPESYFIKNKALFYTNNAPATLTYQSSSTTLTSYIVNFSFEFTANTITASQITIEHIGDEHPSTETQTNTYGIYHPFQPVTVIGYTQNPVVHVPKTSCIPIFYLLYAYEAKEINDFEIGLLNFTELAFNLVLNFTGVGAIEDIAYLTEISGIAEAATLADTTPVLFWDTFLNINKTVSVTVGALNAITGYIEAENPPTDPATADFFQKLNTFLGALSICTMAADVAGQIRLAGTAEDVSNAATGIDESLQLPQEANDAIQQFIGIEEISTQMTTKLNSLPNDSTNISSRFSALNDEQKRSFFNNFFALPNNDTGWVKLNTIYGSGRTLVDDWKEIQTLVKYRSNINFLVAYRYISKNVTLLSHVLDGEINPAGNAVGCYSNVAITNGKARIDSITEASNPDGYYQAQISVFNASNLPVSKSGFSTFFNDSWNGQRITEEMSLAFINKRLIQGDAWNGTLTDGYNCRLIIVGGSTDIMDDTTSIVTAYPLITF